MSDSVVCEQEEQHVDAGVAADVDAGPDASAGSSAEDDFEALVVWVGERRAEDHHAAQIYNAMRASGWSVELASAALLRALPAGSEEEIRILSRGAPDPDFSRSPTHVTIDGHTVQVLCEMRHPRVVVFGNLLTGAECEELMAGAAARLERSTVTPDGDVSDVSDVRTSSGMFYDRGETPLCQRLDARIAALLDWPITHAEDMQVLRYAKDQQYVPHHDYFDAPQWGAVYRRGGQRVGSLVIYLNTPALGGSTVFPDVPLDVRAIAGNAVFFAYPTPDASSRTLHGGAPVIEGEKWVAVKWLRQGTFT